MSNANQKEIDKAQKEGDKCVACNKVGVSAAKLQKKLKDRYKMISEIR